MKNRIRKFIEYKMVSPGELAILLGVQRSNVSHVLNGRNKPGAVFIENFLNQFPDINARWLLTGKGEMLVSRKENLDGLFLEKEKKDNSRLVETKENDLKSEEMPVKQAELSTEKTKTERSDRKIEKIVIFYVDNTFKEYQPF